jgi:predicted HD phosphohydrolase
MEEKEHFEASDPIWREKVALRRFDDGAKVVGRRTRDLQEWWSVANRVYRGEGRPTIEMVETESIDHVS